MLYIKDIYPFKGGYNYELYDTEAGKVTTTGWTTDPDALEKSCKKYNKRQKAMLKSYRYRLDRLTNFQGGFLSGL